MAGQARHAGKKHAKHSGLQPFADDKVCAQRQVSAVLLYGPQHQNGDRIAEIGPDVCEVNWPARPGTGRCGVNSLLLIRAAGRCTLVLVVASDDGLTCRSLLRHCTFASSVASETLTAFLLLALFKKCGRFVLSQVQDYRFEIFTARGREMNYMHLPNAPREADPTPGARSNSLYLAGQDQVVRACRVMGRPMLKNRRICQ